jgi:cytochrome c biogenesis protein ResB
MVTIVVDTPLNFDDVICYIRGDHGIAPVITGLVVVDTDSRVVSTWPTSANLGSFKVGPSSDWFEDGAFGAGINSSLSRLASYMIFIDQACQKIPQTQAAYDLTEWSSTRER